MEAPGAGLLRTPLAHTPVRAECQQRPVDVVCVVNKGVAAAMAMLLPLTHSAASRATSSCPVQSSQHPMLQHMQQLPCLRRPQSGSQGTVWPGRLGPWRVAAGPPGPPGAVVAGLEQREAYGVCVVVLRLQAARLHDLVQLKAQLSLIGTLARQQQDPGSIDGWAAGKFRIELACAVGAGKFGLPTAACVCIQGGMKGTERHKR